MERLPAAAPARAGRGPNWTSRALVAALLLGALEAAERTWALSAFLGSGRDHAGFALLVLGTWLGAGLLAALLGNALRAGARWMAASSGLPRRAALALLGALAGGALAAWGLFSLTLTVRFDRVLARWPLLLALGVVSGAAAGAWGGPGERRGGGGRWNAVAAGVTLVGVYLMNAYFAPQSSYGVHLLLDTVLAACGLMLAGTLPAPGARARLGIVALAIALLAWCERVNRTDPVLEALLKTRTSTSGRIVDGAGFLLDWDGDGSAPPALVGGRDVRPLDRAVPVPILERTRPGARGGSWDAGGPATTWGPGARPHLLLVTLDGCRADVVAPADYARSPLGTLRPATPVLDSLAREAAVFPGAYSPSAGTVDTFHSLFSGSDLPGILAGVPEERFLPQRLARAGYALAAYCNDRMLGGSAWGWPHVESAAAEHGREMAQGVARFLADRADSRPGFVWFHVMDIHAEVLNPLSPEAYRRYSHLERYALGLSRVERILGDLMAELRRLGLASRTLVVISADHGEEFGEHGHFHHNLSLYEPAIRVPLWVSGPGVVPGVRPAEVAMQDVYPTLLEAGGVPAGEAAGRSLWPELRDPARRSPPRRLYSFLPQRGFSRRYARFMRPELGQAALVDPGGGHKVILRLGDETLEAYDLLADPGERTNLARARPVWADTLLDELYRRVLGRPWDASALPLRH